MFMAETGDFFVVRSVDGGNFDAGDGASSSGVSLRDVSAADEADVNGHGISVISYQRSVREEG